MQIRIYHTNDLHSNYDNQKKIFKYLKDHKTDNDLYLDSGDYTDLKDLIVQSDKGVSAIDIINQCGLDAITVGNNELDLGFEDLARVSYKTNMVCCNITNNDNQKIGDIKDYTIITKNNIRFLVIGIAPYYNREMKDNNFNAFFCLYNVKVHPSLDIVKNIIEVNKGKYDFCILLSHNGSIVEDYFLEHIPEIDLVLGGHTHTELIKDKYNQTGQYGNNIGVVTLDINDKEIRIINNELIKLDACECKEFDELLSVKKAKADELLSEDLNALDDLEFDPYNECDLINFLCDAMYKYMDGDLAVMHNGIANNALVRPVSWKTLIECFPSKLNPTTLTVEGSRLLEAIELSFNSEHTHQEGKGAGFRGYTLGTLSYSKNVRINLNPLQVFINDELLDVNKKYKLIVDDYLQRGSGYPSFKTSDDDCHWDKWFIRDLMKKYIDDDEIYKSCKIRRIKKG